VLWPITGLEKIDRALGLEFLALLFSYSGQVPMTSQGGFAQNQIPVTSVLVINSAREAAYIADFLSSINFTLP
jgi:hypothetical protein